MRRASVSSEVPQYLVDKLEEKLEVSAASLNIAAVLSDFRRNPSILCDRLHDPKNGIGNEVTPVLKGKDLTSQALIKKKIFPPNQSTSPTEMDEFWRQCMHAFCVSRSDGDARHGHNVIESPQHRLRTVADIDIGLDEFGSRASRTQNNCHILVPYLSERKVEGRAAPVRHINLHPAEVQFYFQVKLKPEGKVQTCSFAFVRWYDCKSFNAPKSITIHKPFVYSA